MNIGIVTTWFERGAAYVSRAYMDVLSKENNVFIYTRGGEKQAKTDPKWDLPNVTYTPIYLPIGTQYQPYSNYTRSYVYMVHYHQWLKDNKIDIVIVNEWLDIPLFKLTKNLGYIIGIYIDYYKEETVNQFAVCDFFLCNTKRHYSVFKKFPNSIYIPWGTDIELFKPKKYKKDKFTFFHSAGYAGTNIRKGTDLLLKAFSQVKGDCKLIIHSQVPATKYGHDFRYMLESDSRIEFIEKTVSAPGLYHLGDAYVYPSKLEGIGLSIPEALACGLPVITTNNAPMNEFVEDGVNGLLVKVAKSRTRKDNYYWPESIVDIDDLAKKMQQYVDDHELFRKHKANARKSAEEKYDWQKNASGLSEFLNSLIKQIERTKRNSTLIEKALWVLETKYVSFLTLQRTVAHKTRSFFVK